MRKLKRGVVWGFWIVVAILALIVFIVFKTPEPPVNELKIAREALHSAQKAEAEVYARAEYEKARQAYDSAMMCWSAENERFFLVRNYSGLEGWIAQVIDSAVAAEKLSGQRVKSANTRVKSGLSSLEKKIALYEKYYKRMPLPSSVSKAHNRGVLKYSEAKFAWENKRYGEADKNFSQAQELIDSSNEKAERIVRDWFGAHGEWRQHADQAIRMSRSGQKVILVDKLDHSCVVYQNGKIVRSFEAELGINWMGDKQRSGDKATPEGIYRVTQKKEGSRTKFYKALLINFPNQEDVSRVAKAKKQGLIPKKANIGGLIEIHGLGGKGVDWTDGCVALRNSDMDALYRLASVGTPVIIVGSLQSLNEVVGKN
ncbi:MAG: murein L,D-transpeptidase family protein [Mangrovibacterium sp.]